ncbi:monofunctional biosynthetic peptidoglycan transglycosylase [Aureimonas endophytica]|uniref:Biosynthetic peptidoglycan transglycosylase n=1 Tax=Aureimonas endophytica TaxID=2027858 RepID=A0A917EBC8_9HYPH|nr:transglycosylase domain-containing protein [Aureimonas endophytica]GGE21014.1 monofunctional biosynthetic peptidoglycan transglycosylase [Aureimonas endophytica]
MLRRALGFLIVTLTVMVALPIALVPVYAIPFVHPVSTLMIGDWLRFRSVQRDWVPIENISPVLIRTVMLSEDGQYCSHRGVDWRELNGVIDDALDGQETRGASTIPMQTAKNLFLWTSRSFVRKGLEVPLALYTDLVLSKSRLMEIYLNVAEFGAGIYGVEAASWHYFEKPAFALSSREAALLAKTLPAPSRRDPGKPSRQLAQLARGIEARARAAGDFSACVVANGATEARAEERG